MKRLSKAIVALAILAACSGSSGWSESQRSDFVAGCTSKGQSESNCVCMQKKVEAAHPDLKDPADLDQDELVRFAEECIK